MTDEQLQNVETLATSLIKEITDIGLNLDVAKKVAIKVLRRNIDELSLIDGAYMIGLKERIELHRQTILKIIDK